MRTTIKSVASVAVFVAAAAMSAGSFAAEAKKSSVDTFTTNVYTQALVDRMDANKDGKVSKAEFMKFVEAEWNVLDKNKDGVLQTTEFANREYFQRSQNAAKD